MVVPLQGVVWPWMLIAVYNQIQVGYIINLHTMRQLSDSCAKSVAKGELRGPSRASSQLEFIEPTQSVNSVRTGHTGQWRRFELAILAHPQHSS